MSSIDRSAPEWQVEGPASGRSRAGNSHRIRALGLGLMALARRAIEGLAAWRRQRRQRYLPLTALSDRVLADIGLRRSDLEAVDSGILPTGHLERNIDPPAPMPPSDRRDPPVAGWDTGPAPSPEEDGATILRFVRLPDAA